MIRRHVADAADKLASSRRTLRVLRDVTECRTQALGGHLDECTGCDWQRPSYNSCRNRHCPQCQAGRRRAWTELREARHLPVPHFQAVFTLPAQLRELARANPRLVYDLLFEAGQTVLQGLARQLYTARLAIFGVLHTWTREMAFHPHVHFVVSGGGLSLDGERWVALPTGYLFPVARMAAWFREIVLAKLKAAFLAGDLDTGGRSFASVRRSLGIRRWVVNVQPPENRPPEQAIRYLARYVYGVAISDARIVSSDPAGAGARFVPPVACTARGLDLVHRCERSVVPARVPLLSVLRRRGEARGAAGRSPRATVVVLMRVPVPGGGGLGPVRPWSAVGRNLALQRPCFTALYPPAGSASASREARVGRSGRASGPLYP